MTTEEKFFKEMDELFDNMLKIYKNYYGENLSDENKKEFFEEINNIFNKI